MASVSASGAIESKASSDSKALHKRAVRWEVAVIITLFGAWTAAYFCRVPLFLVEKEFQVEEGVNDKLLGIMMAGGYTVYPMGKVVFGLLTDRWGGRFALFTCLLMTPLLSALLALGSSYGWFFVAWLCLRFFQASGWIGLVKLAGGWVPYHRQGRVMGFLSLSMLAGDFLAREVLAAVMTAASWSGVLLVGAAVTGVYLVLAAIVLRPDPSYRGLPLPEAHPDSVFAGAEAAAHAHTELVDSDDEGSEAASGVPHSAKGGAVPEGVQVELVPIGAGQSAGVEEANAEQHEQQQQKQRVSTRLVKKKHGVLALLVPLFKDRMFLLVCLLSYFLTATRETIMTFSVSFLQTEAGASKAAAAAVSAIVPACGIPAVLLTGWAIDKLPARYRGLCLPIALAPGVVGLLYLAFVSEPNVWLAAASLGAVGAALMGPYSLLAGTFALEIGGSIAAGSAAAVIDAAGYVGAFSMMLLRTFELSFGAMFKVLFFVILLAVATGLALWKVMAKRGEGGGGGGGSSSTSSHDGSSESERA